MKWPGLVKFKEQGYSVSCGFDQLRVFLRTNVVDEVVVTLPLRSLHSYASEIARAL